MSTERVSQVRGICRAFLESPAEMREGFLHEACGNDAELRSAVEAQLALGEASTVLASKALSLIGEQLNAYRMVSFLGAGAMGEVYRAHDTVLGRDVAIKTLPAAFASVPERLDRFRREARVLASLNHPHIAAIYGLEECNGVHFLVLELVEGATLAQYIANGGGTLSETCRIGAQVAEALSFAHRKGVIHRDLKPANVNLTAEGRVKVLDFGLAKVLSGGAADGPSVAATAAGRVLGTPAYMSPEQVRGHSLDARSDIWAFGCLMYELLAGKHAFGRGSMGDTFAAILKDEPDWKALPPETPPPLASLIRRCLDKDAARRLDDLETAQRTIEQATSSAPSHAVFSRRNAMQAGILALAVGVTVAGIYGFNHWQAKHAGPSIKSLAVLPFINDSADKDWDYLADGVTESMINRLSRIRDLTVMSRSAVYRAAKPGADAIEKGRQLNVDAILTGAIRHFPDRLEASVELVDCATGRHVWGEHYSQAFVDPLNFERSAVDDAATQLRAQLDSGQKQNIARDYTANLDAYRLYLKGRYEWNKRNLKASEAALGYFHQALDLDPSYALAYSGIADAYSYESGFLPASEIFPKAQAAALKAIELDPDLAEAHSSLGFYYEMYAWDWAKAEAEFRRALAVNPNYASAHSMYSRLLQVLGRFPEAEREVVKAQALDPLSWGFANNVGLELYLARDYARAEKQFLAVMPLNPASFGAESYLALTRAAAGRPKEALLGFQKILRANPTDLNTMAGLARSYALVGQKKEANDLMETIRKSPALSTVLPTTLAADYGALGEMDQAFAEMDRAFSERCWYLIFLNVEPIFDQLRPDPRFRALQKRMALPVN